MYGLLISLFTSVWLYFFSQMHPITGKIIDFEVLELENFVLLAHISAFILQKEELTEVSVLLQAQFLSDGSSGPGLWIVPITSCCGSYDAQKKFLLKGKTDKVHIDLTASQNAGGEKGENCWIKLNVDQTGFYRVKYDDELAAGLEKAIKANKLSLMDKIGNDKMNFQYYSYNISLSRF